MNQQDKDQLRDLVAERLELVGPEKVDVVKLPVMNMRIEPVTDARKSELAESIEEEFYARKDRSKVTETLTPLDLDSVLAVCRTCRGSCCEAGENHAFLTRANLERIKREQRVASKAALLKIYLDRVPEVAYAEGCIFQGERGCVLPRELRSETCNRFLCYPLKKLGRDFGRSGYAQVAVAPVEGGEPRMLLLKDGEARDVCPDSVS